jgi:hypothetical protein
MQIVELMQTVDSINELIQTTITTHFANRRSIVIVIMVIRTPGCSGLCTSRIAGIAISTINVCCGCCHCDDPLVCSNAKCFRQQAQINFLRDYVFRQWIKDLIDTDEVVFGQPSINVLRNKFFDFFNGIVIVWTNLTDSLNSQLH